MRAAIAPSRPAPDAAPVPRIPVGLAGVAYHLPDGVVPLAELHAGGRLRSAPELLAGFGFRQARIARGEDHVELALAAARRVLEETGTDPDEVGLLLHAGALASSSTLAPDSAPGGAALLLPEVADLFTYPVSRIQAELDLTRAAAVGIGQQGCASLFSALRIARALLLAEPDLGAALCVAADRLPPDAPREMIYNVVSDGAAAALLRPGWPSNRILACGHVTKGAFWDTAALENEIVAAYFPTARTLIEGTLEKAGLGIDDIDWIVPHNVSLRSWEILLGLLGVPRERLFGDNIGRVGHTIASDNLLNLRDLLDSGRVRPGQRLLLFTFGYGLNWSCLVLER